MHFAIFLGYEHIVKEFVQRNADLNILTVDGWSCLQLAIHKNNFEIVKILINSQKININDITPKGVAILIATQLSLT